MSGPNVVVLGSGFGGLEATFYLRHRLGDRVDLTLVSDHDYFLFKPNTIYIPFGADPETFKVPLDDAIKRKHIRFIPSHVAGVDPERQRVLLSDQELAYDYLVIATGADMRPQEIPGLSEHALTVWTPVEMLRLRTALAALSERAKSGEHQRLLFLIPPNNRCSGPLYEMSMMTDTWLRRQGSRDNVDMTWTTYEDGFIQAFGPRLNTVVKGEFEERGIHGFNGYVVTSVEPGVVRYQNGESCEYDLLLSFPPYVAKETYTSLPSDARGFINVVPDSRRVKGQDRIFAVGDAADFPIKQAFLALLQGDAAAEHIAAEILNEAPKLTYEPMSMCVMEELNRATFAQVPLTYTGDPLKPVTVATDDTDHYKVGVSPLWRLGKAVLGIYAPWRFGHGEPFHAGFAWDAMDLGLKVMSRLMAR
ncbi:MAG TPA: FAD-dependent oxidoreductase [Candidatus Dormibacteraeota bacterium]|nr:FAD-dependent oxidoreductase [Candidatus Dormibacteraeota bacterium]